MSIHNMADAPGTSESWLSPERNMLMRLVRFDKRIVRAIGNLLFDDAGVEYLDFSSQYGAVPFGYNPASLWRVLREVEEARAPSLIQPLISSAAELLAQRLSELAPGRRRRVIFTNSGAESVEVAIKACRARSGRRVILATRRGFHGKTLGAVSATGTSQYREPFLVDTTAFEHIDYDDLNALHQRLAGNDVAAFIVEPVQGEGGMVVPSAGYLQGVQRACREHGTLLVVDEVQTGLGRTGRLFASEWEGLDPDVLLLAKALGGGLVPLGACLVAEDAWAKDVGLLHSSTFANNNLTCSVGLGVLDELLKDDRAMLARAAEAGDYLGHRLEALHTQYPTVIAGHRGRGLMRGLALHPWPTDESYFLEMVNHLGYIVPLLSGYLLNEHRVLMLPTISSTNVLRVQPSLVSDVAQIDRALAALDAACQLIREERFDALLSYAAGGAPSSQRRPLRRREAGVVSAGAEGRRGTFAFLIHPTEAEDLVHAMPNGIEDYRAAEKDQLRQWLRDWRAFNPPPAPVHYTPSVESASGGFVDGWLISCLHTPRELLRLSASERGALIAGYLSAARSVGATMIGLGAFTSVITRGGTDIADTRVPLTTGNSLTALTCVEALQRVAYRLGRPLHAQTVAVIGAAGSVGRLAALDVASRCRRLVLFGNPANPSAIRGVRAVAGEIYRHLIELGEHGIPGRIRVDMRALLSTMRSIPHELLAGQDAEANLALFDFVQDAFASQICRAAPIAVSISLKDKLNNADAIISATSNGGACVHEDWVADDAIVCDAGRPSDLSPHVRTRCRGAFVFEGGLVQLPHEVRFGRHNILGFPPGVNLACLSETIALAMSGVRRSFSMGSRISLAEARGVRSIADGHGFKCHVPELSFEPTLAGSSLTVADAASQPPYSPVARYAKRRFGFGPNISTRDDGRLVAERREGPSDGR